MLSTERFADAVLDALSAEGAPLAVEQLCRRTRLRPLAVRQAVRVLAGRGDVQGDGLGRWTAVHVHAQTDQPD